MLLIDRRKLKTKIECKVKLAKKLGISRKSLYLKLKGKLEFKESEIRKLYDLYGKEIEV